jgi:2-polyprenyl-3-methyl-5-hydroxy-6-metoxy-1,4-benzoquinol methylase
MDPRFTEAYEEFELHHWWQVARRRIILDFIERYVLTRNGRSPRWLDVGCSTGILLGAAPAITDKLGIDADAASIAKAQQRGLDCRVVPPSADWNLAQYGAFDLITLCDVVEHVEHDHHAITAAHEALRPGGVLLVTAPAMKSLWSAHDVLNHHFRRYSRNELHGLCADKSKWTILKLSYFSTFLLPMIWTTRKVKNIRYGMKPDLAHSDIQTPGPMVNWTLERIFASERLFLRHAQFPVGSSLILAAKKVAAT